MTSNVIPLRKGQDAADARHTVRENELSAMLDTSNFIFVGKSPADGSIKFNIGEGLNIGDVTYMQKVFNIKCDDIIAESMYGENDDV